MAFYCRKAPRSGETVGVLTTLRQNCARANSRVNKLCGGWRYFMANCPKGNQLCSGMSGAWLPVVTVCANRLY